MIKIISYQDRWPEEFRVLALKLKAQLGNSACIHHIGSTSVPFLAAKDVIDIQITVDDLSASLGVQLTQLGFEPTPITKDHSPLGLMIPPMELEKRFFRINNRFNLHIRKQGSFNQKYPILFRDYLRVNPAARDAYGEIKKQLARFFSENADGYYDVKDPVCDLIITSALEWAKSSCWQPGPSDV